MKNADRYQFYVTDNADNADRQKRNTYFESEKHADNADNADGHFSNNYFESFRNQSNADGYILRFVRITVRKENRLYSGKRPNADNADTLLLLDVFVRESIRVYSLRYISIGKYLSAVSALSRGILQFILNNAPEPGVIVKVERVDKRRVDNG